MPDKARDPGESAWLGRLWSSIATLPRPWWLACRRGRGVSRRARARPRADVAERSRAAHADSEAAAGSGREVAAGARRGGHAAAARSRWRNAPDAVLTSLEALTPEARRARPSTATSRTTTTLRATCRASPFRIGASRRCPRANALQLGADGSGERTAVQVRAVRALHRRRQKAKSLPPLTPEALAGTPLELQRRRPAPSSRRSVDRPRHAGRRAQRLRRSTKLAAGVRRSRHAARSEASVRRSRRAPARSTSSGASPSRRCCSPLTVLGRPALRETHGPRHRAHGADDAADPRDPARRSASR